MSFETKKIKKISQIKLDQICSTTLNNKRLLLPNIDVIRNRLFAQMKDKYFKELEKTGIIELVNKEMFFFVKNKFLNQEESLLLGEINCHKIRIDRCQRVIGNFKLNSQKLLVFNIILFDPFHQLNIFDSIGRLDKIALKYVYHFLKISKCTLEEVKDYMKRKINIFDVAQYLIQNQNKNDFSRMKVIQLVYLAYCKYLVDHKKPLFDDGFESWWHGPVSSKLYLRLICESKILSSTTKIVKNFDEKKFTNTNKQKTNKQNINKQNTNKQNTNDQNTDDQNIDDPKKVLDYILEKYGKLTPNKLVDIVQKDFSPWTCSFTHDDWSLNVISNKKILDFYSKSENLI